MLFSQLLDPGLSWLTLIFQPDPLQPLMVPCLLQRLTRPTVRLQDSLHQARVGRAARAHQAHPQLSILLLLLRPPAKQLHQPSPLPARADRVDRARAHRLRPAKVRVKAREVRVGVRAHQVKEHRARAQHHREHQPRPAKVKVKVKVKAKEATHNRQQPSHSQHNPREDKASLKEVKVSRLHLHSPKVTRVDPNPHQPRRNQHNPREDRVSHKGVKVSRRLHSPRATREYLKG